jgi:hypothetical protein
VFKNSILWRIFGPRWDEVTGDWRKVHNELRSLYSQPSVFRIIKATRIWAAQVTRTGEKRNASRILVEKLGKKVIRKAKI